MLIELVLGFLEELFGGLTFETILIIIGSIMFFFLLVRGIYTWYWKISRIVKNQKIQNELLNEILTQLKKDR